jgi:hypothetical protein
VSQIPFCDPTNWILAVANKACSRCRRIAKVSPAAVASDLRSLTMACLVAFLDELARVAAASGVDLATRLHVSTKPPGMQSADSSRGLVADSSPMRTRYQAPYSQRNRDAEVSASAPAMSPLSHIMKVCISSFVLVSYYWPSTFDFAMSETTFHLEQVGGRYKSRATNASAT